MITELRAVLPVCVKGRQSMCDPWHRPERSESGADRRYPAESHRDRLCQDLPTAEAHHRGGLPEAGWCPLKWLSFTVRGGSTRPPTAEGAISLSLESFLPDPLFRDSRLNYVFKSHLDMTDLYKIYKQSIYISYRCLVPINIALTSTELF